MTLFIGISGKLGAGKDTVGAMLAAELGAHKVVKTSFAAPLKVMAGALTGNRDFVLDLEGRADRGYKDAPAPGFGMTNGQILQKLGDVARDTFGRDVFLRGLARLGDSLEVVIFTDMRYPAEAEWVQAQPRHLLVRVNGDPAGERARSSRDPNHSSETALDEWDFDVVIDNTGDRAHLAVQVKKLAERCL